MSVLGIQHKPIEWAQFGLKRALNEELYAEIRNIELRFEEATDDLIFVIKRKKDMELFICRIQRTAHYGDVMRDLGRPFPPGENERAKLILFLS